MRKSVGVRQRRGGMRNVKRATSVGEREPVREVIGAEEIRKIVIEITNRSGVEGFVGRMMRLHTAVEAGRDEEVEKIRRESKERTYGRLMNEVNDAVKRGSKVEALNIIFNAARYGYENSLEHGGAMMMYLRRFTEGCN